LAGRESEAGFSLVALLATITIMLIMMGAATPYWKYVAKDMHEEELFFRGDQIASAIERYQKKNGGALPTSLDALVKGKFLRKAYADPMVKHGKWRLVRQGEVQMPGTGSRSSGGATGSATGSATTLQPLGDSKDRPGTPASPPPQSLGPFLGVVSTSKEKSLRLMNGRDRYDQWLFIAGQQRVLGRQETVLKPGQLPLPGQPGGQPTPPGGIPPNKS
jgi:type II secretory pathway pseudopilin PulG